MVKLGSPTLMIVIFRVEKGLVRRKSNMGPPCTSRKAESCLLLLFSKAIGVDD
jgi:hypothetical protein